jgi:magnesium transporter
VQIDCGLYVDGQRVNSEGSPSQLLEQAKLNGGFVWLGLVEPDLAEFGPISKDFELHELAIEDAIHAQQRSKVEDYGDLEFVVLKTLYYDEATSQVETGDLMMYVGSNFIITIRHGERVGLSAIRKKLEANPSWMKQGPYAVVHSIIDHVVDIYLQIATEIENDVAALEEKVFSNQRKSWSQDLYFLKREVIEFRRGVEPMSKWIPRFALNLELNVPDGMREFFRDIEDHISRASDTAASLDNLLASALNADIAQVQLRQNEDVRKITAWVALAAVPTMVAGIYGMNFDYMWELRQPAGYPVVVGSLALLCGILYRKFKKSGWL